MLLVYLDGFLIVVFSLATLFFWLEMRKVKLAIVTFCLLVVCIVGLIYLAPIGQANQDANHMQNMQQAVGITNDKTSPIIISQSINVTGELHGTMFLFAGSINSEMQDNLRIGYVAPNGASYIINVPIEKVVFIQKENVLPSGSFHFTDWYEDLTLQGNINKNLGEISINLTPDEFLELIQ